MSTTLQLGTYPVMGGQYADFSNLRNSHVKEMEGEYVDFVLEPDNRYDSNAIILMFHEKKMGYVPKTINSILLFLLEQADRCIVYGRISKIDTGKQLIQISYSLEV